MAEEPTLPQLPSVSWDSETQTFSNNARKRVKRSRTAVSLFSNSSDPAVFSSDDDPHAENYTHGRHKKKRYVGSWFQQNPASSDSGFSEETRLPPLRKRPFERQLDSGVWMGSDESTDFDDSSMGIPAPSEPKLPQLRMQRVIKPLSPAQAAAEEVIRAAIEEGNENIDLSSRGLESLPNSVVSRLSEFTCIPIVAENVPFEQRDPSLRLFLAGNPLIRAPGAVFQLEYLRVLSLRNTGIKELPPAIGNLRNLESLNLSLNQLRYLPAELLNLITYPGKLKYLMIHPNPLCQPSDRPEIRYENQIDTYPAEPASQTLLLHESVDNDGATTRFWLDKSEAQDGVEYPLVEHPESRRWQGFAIARSPVQFDDSRGFPLSKFRLQDFLSGDQAEPSSVRTLPTEDLESPPALPQSRFHPERQSRVPSLFELALRTCSRTAHLPDLASYLPPHSPQYLSGLFEHMMDQAEANGSETGQLLCSICTRKVVMPTARWIEWWDLSRVSMRQDEKPSVRIPLGTVEEERALPFLRQACSWGCLPQPMQIGQRLPGTVKWSREMPDETLKDAF